MGRGTVRTAGGTPSTMGVGTPLILWVGGRDHAEGARLKEAPAPSRGAGRRPLDWRLLWASLILSLTFALGAMVARGAVLGAVHAGLRWEDHTVAAGETIGSILAARNLPDVGLGRLVDWVEERNGLEDAAIVPGQVLSIPT